MNEENVKVETMPTEVNNAEGAMLPEQTNGGTDRNKIVLIAAAVAALGTGAYFGVKALVKKFKAKKAVKTEEATTTETNESVQ